MSARRGTLTFTRLFARGAPPRDFRNKYVQAVRHRTFQPLEIEAEAVEASGWCVMERPFDLEIDTEKLYHDRYLLLGFRVDRWRIPTATFKAHYAEEEQRLLAKTGREKLTRSQRQELKQRVTVRLRRKVLPSSRAFDVCWDTDSGTVLFFSHSQRTLTDFCALFEKTFGLALDEDSPYVASKRANLPAALERALKAVEPLSISSGRKLLAKRDATAGRAARVESPRAASTGDAKNGASADDADGAAAGESSEVMERVESTRFLGGEFLIWLWMRAELVSDELELPDIGACQAWLDNHLTLVSAIDPSERIMLRGAAPAGSAEAKEALKAQKVPLRAKMAMRLTDRDYSLVFDAQRFAIGSAALPAVITDESEDAFLERMYLLEQFLSALDGFFAAFLGDRLAAGWAATWEPAFVSWIEREQVTPELLSKLVPARPKSRTRARATA